MAPVSISPGGVSGLALLSESHLACHTYPEFGAATFNLYCCRNRTRWPWETMLKEMLGATEVQVRVFRTNDSRSTLHSIEQEPLNECARRELPVVRRTG